MTTKNGFKNGRKVTSFNLSETEAKLLEKLSKLWDTKTRGATIHKCIRKAAVVAGVLKEERE